ncbi:hypothetical protein EV424DRAFT_1546663 [Suillus variegatus]|nr:hypothetical protein EV424DRAFT_1546663 [Suillus variegatus]
MHCEFPPERALDPPILTQHKVFSRAVDLIPPTMPGLPAPLTLSAPPKILKPRGEVSHLNRGGYNLQEKLGWSLSEYEDIRSFIIHLAPYWNKLSNADKEAYKQKAAAAHLNSSSSAQSVPGSD